MGIANLSWTSLVHFHTSQHIFLESIVHRYTQHSLQLFLRLHCPSLSLHCYLHKKSEKEQNHLWAELKDMVWAGDWSKPKAFLEENMTQHQLTSEP